jgi:DNA-binding HxlR family transcriptional regulator
MMAVAKVTSKAARGDTPVTSTRLHRGNVSTRPSQHRLASPAKHPSREIDLRDRIHRLALLFHRRWNVPVLAELWRGDAGSGGAKFITLANRLSKRAESGRISHDSLKATLNFLIKHDYVMRNPGYGHPMRPEYLLAETGYDIAPHCQLLVAKLDSMGTFSALSQRKWTVPVVFAVGHGIERFGQLKSVLPKITPRALTLTLKQLTEVGVVQRGVIDSHPPFTNYRLTASAQSLLPILARF